MELAHAVRNSYVAHLGGPEVLGQLTWAEARARGWAFATDTVALGDGAPWIWNQVRDHFYDSQQIAECSASLHCVDWYHSVEHLHNAARLVQGAEDGPTQKRWYNSLETLLFQGHGSRVSELLDKVAATKPEPLAEDLQSEATFFRKQKRRIQYLEMRTRPCRSEAAWSSPALNSSRLVSMVLECTGGVAAFKSSCPFALPFSASASMICGNGLTTCP